MAKNGLFPYPALICLSVVLVSFVVFLWPTVILFLNLERGVWPCILTIYGQHPSFQLSVTVPHKEMCLDAKLMYFNDRYNIALLYIDLNVTLELPSIGFHPQYGEEVFVLARDGGASLRVRRGNIKWLEESGFLGRDRYMFLSSAIPEVIIIFILVFYCCYDYLILWYFFDAGWQWRNGD